MLLLFAPPPLRLTERRFYRVSEVGGKPESRCQVIGPHGLQEAQKARLHKVVQRDTPGPVCGSQALVCHIMHQPPHLPPKLHELVPLARLDRRRQFFITHCLAAPFVVECG